MYSDFYTYILWTNWIYSSLRYCQILVIYTWTYVIKEQATTNFQVAAAGPLPGSADILAPVNNFLHYLFSQIVVTLNDNFFL